MDKNTNNSKTLFKYEILLTTQKDFTVKDFESTLKEENPTLDIFNNGIIPFIDYLCCSKKVQSIDNIYIYQVTKETRGLCLDFIKKDKTINRQLNYLVSSFINMDSINTKQITK